MSNRSMEELLKENDRLRLELSNAKVEIAKSQQMITSLMIKLETLTRDYEKAVMENTQGEKTITTSCKNIIIFVFIHFL